MSIVDFDAVAEVIRAVAAAEVLPRWRNLGAGDVVEKDGPADLVTVADKACEIALTARLAALLPGSRVVGEEAVSVDPSQLELLTGSAPVWVVDPIDGTSAFAAGEPEFAVMVALVADRELAAGWIYAPVAGDMTFGARGAGVWQETAGGRVRLQPPPKVEGLGSLVGVIGRRAFSDSERERVLAKERHFRRFGPVVCAGIDYPKLAAGQSHFALYNKSEPWDHLAGLAMLSELGFHFAKHDGTAYRPGDNTGGLLIAPDAALWQQIRAILLD